MTPAPLALMAYSRPQHLASTISALKASPLFDQTPLTVFVDGPKGAADTDAVEAVRALVCAELPNADHRFAPANRGLAASVIAAVDEMVDRFGRVIVLEDDLLVSPDFLTFLNAGLDRYADDPRVMQVSGFLPPIATPLPSACFLPQTVSWGWATWARAWARFERCPTGHERLRTDRTFRHSFNRMGSYNYTHMLNRQLAGEIDSWAIRFYWSVFKEEGLVLHPPTSLVANAGFDGSGTHGTSGVSPLVRIPTALPSFAWPDKVARNPGVEQRVNSAYRKTFTTPASRLKVRLAEALGR